MQFDIFSAIWVNVLVAERGDQEYSEGAAQRDERVAHIYCCSSSSSVVVAHCVAVVVLMLHALSLQLSLSGGDVSKHFTVKNKGDGATGYCMPVQFSDQNEKGGSAKSPKPKLPSDIIA